jgi:glycerol-3-phosphate O-acyltransferase/dihydroxyacetone phosphate acyltransferase
MSWLDERLFGWSRSAWRGTSAWDRSSSGNPSTQPTPDVSDDEDAGDYDNVLGYLRAYSGETPSRKRARSQQQSYADLQQLRKGEGLSPEGYAGIAKLKNRSDANLAQLAPVYHAKFTTSASPPQVKTDLPTGESPEHSPTDADGLHLRRGGRERRSSLTDNIPVGRIGELSPTESFKEGTSYLNRENEMRKKSTSNDVRKDE